MYFSSTPFRGCAWLIHKKAALAGCFFLLFDSCLSDDQLGSETLISIDNFDHVHAAGYIPEVKPDLIAIIVGYLSSGNHLALYISHGDLRFILDIWQFYDEGASVRIRIDLYFIAYDIIRD